MRGELSAENPTGRSISSNKKPAVVRKIIQELLQFTRPRGPEPAWTDVRESVEKSLALIENHLYKHKVELYKSFDVELPEIYIDAKQLEQVCSISISTPSPPCRTAASSPSRQKSQHLLTVTPQAS